MALLFSVCSITLYLIVKTRIFSWHIILIKVRNNTYHCTAVFVIVILTLKLVHYCIFLPDKKISNYMLSINPISRRVWNCLFVNIVNSHLNRLCILYLWGNLLSVLSHCVISHLSVYSFFRALCLLLMDAYLENSPCLF